MTTSADIAFRKASQAVKGLPCQPGINVLVNQDPNQITLYVEFRIGVQVPGTHQTQVLTISTKYRFPVTDILIMDQQAFNEYVQEATTKFAQKAHAHVNRCMHDAMKKERYGRAYGCSYTRFSGTNTSVTSTGSYWAFMQ
jgi:hypothetical protein